MHDEIQRIVQEDVNGLALDYGPFRNASRSSVKDFFQNPMGRFRLETTSIEKWARAPAGPGRPAGADQRPHEGPYLSGKLG